ncbi:signal-induced proliferation-associated 1-like protein 1 isoform X2 [Agrilus planipennis]|uniref:Signal-induced proliferation-associated 1-like protein 1 isoform X2 n=1 Tax=Agrilus planipennis TaxID=224129 RepID=A0A1W4WTY3_AGRPL|nr:signal-induced proliferation-associated 1-like protein 1 isoform X2 [Agrilus planipennis]
MHDGMIGLEECGPAPPRASPSSLIPSSSTNRTRERTVQAVEYYNNHLQRARAKAGLTTSTTTSTNNATTHHHHHHAPSSLSTTRASYNDRHHIHHHNISGNQRKHVVVPDLLYRSNSSLELLDHHHQGRSTASSCSSSLKREYGSHGSIDVIERDRPLPIAGNSDSFFAMLQDYRPTVLNAIGTDQRSPGPAEYLKGKVDAAPAAENATNSLAGDETSGSTHQLTPQSPKFRVKLSKIWGSGNVNGGGSVKLNNHHYNHHHSNHYRHAFDDSVVNTSTMSTSTSSAAASALIAEAEEIQRRRAFVHYDCQSLTTNLSYAVRIRKNLLAKRRNTTTGASAASMIARSSTPEGGGSSSAADEEDYGDGKSNDMVESCPFFRNEIGGEEERVVSLTRVPCSSDSNYRYHYGGGGGGSSSGSGQNKKPLHRPPLAYGVAVLEFPIGETHWRHSTCPYQRLPRPIESVDQGALYYRRYFLGREHQNWFGMDDQLGPVAISIRREKVPHPDGGLTTSSSPMQYQYRLIIRTSELLTLRGAILEDAVPNIKPSNGKTMNVKEVLDYVAPEIQISCLRLGVQSLQTEDQLLKLDEQGLTNHYKVGVMYCRAGQSSEEEMYNNEEAGPAFQEFLECIGKKVRLKGFENYKAGLDNKSDSTGLYSVYAQYQDCEVMFHVSTMLPFTPNNRQQLLRKRHIGNDIVTIVFQEPGALPFTPKNIRSQFQHVFIVVRAINPCTENTHYSVAVSRSKDVQVFGPPIKDGAIFPKGKAFAEFLLAKVVNAENAAHMSEKFVTMATRTRQEYLKDLVTNFSTTSPVETGQKFSIFGNKKKDKIRPRFIPDACQRGAILWQVMLDDNGQSQQIECYLGISSDTLVLIEEQTRQIVFVTPCKSILGWSPQTNSLRLYHHQGECTTIHMRDGNGDRDELMEIMERLKAVTQGVVVQELSLKRNIMGQLGFHVQPDGVVTLVESAGQAWQAGLRQNSRIVEICKVAVSTLTYDQMVDLLKTSLLVTLTVIPPLPDGGARKGCTLPNCKYNEGNYESDYENNGNNVDDSTKCRKAAQLQKAVPGNHKMIYERSFSPPRSSSSSGYGTGSSSKSFLGHESTKFNNREGTTTSSSSGFSDDQWYDILQEGLGLDLGSPPPLPLKQQNNRTVQPSAAANTYPSSPKRTYNNNNNNITNSNNNINTNNNNNSMSHMQVSQSHNHFGPQHTKVQVSHSLPLQHANYSIPLTAALHNNTYDYDTSYKIDGRNFLKTEECCKYLGNDDQQQQQQHGISGRHHLRDDLGEPRRRDNSRHRVGVVNDSKNREIEYVVTRAPKVAEYTTLQQLNNELRNNLVINDNHSTDSSVTSDRFYGLAGSEDELSNGSGGNSSPRVRRASKHHINSRNQSPRSINGEAKLRPGVTSRSSNRNSANLSSSTFQEELIRLIDPDNIKESSSSANVCDQQPVKLSKETQQEVILTMARPATVISNSSTTSSPLPVEFKGGKDDRLSPRVKGNKVSGSSTDAPLPLPNDIEWSSLVDTATRVMMEVSENMPDVGDLKGAASTGQWSDDGPMDASITSMISSSTSVPELQNTLTELETRVNMETRRRLSLEDEVKRLKEENQKLQDQAQSAVNQLRKFTEWFFKNVQSK